MKSQKAPSKYQKPLWDLRSLPETSKTSWNLRFHFRILEGPSEISYNPHVFRRLLLDLRNLSEISDWSKVPIEIAETSARDLRNVLDISEHCLRSQIDPLRYRSSWIYQINSSDLRRVLWNRRNQALMRLQKLPWDLRTHKISEDPSKFSKPSVKSLKVPWNLRNISEVSEPSLISHNLSRNLRNLPDISEPFLIS